MRKLLVLCSFWLCVATLGAQNAERKLYSVAFYNLENLFDTIHDDYEENKLQSDYRDFNYPVLSGGCSDWPVLDALWGDGHGFVIRQSGAMPDASDGNG